MTGSVASLPPGRVSLAVSFSGMSRPYPKIPLALLLQGHERSLSERRVEAIRKANSDVRRGAAFFEADVLGPHADVARRRDRLGVAVEAEHGHQHVLAARAE